MLPRYFCTLQHLGIGGICRNTGKLNDVFPGFAQALHDFVIDAIFLDGAAAVDKHYRLPVAAGKTGQVLFDTTLSEKSFCCVLKNKVIHGYFPFCNLLPTS